MQWVLQQADSTSRLPLSVLTQSIQGYFDLDWSNRHFVRTCAVSSQWPLSVYEVLVAYRFDPTQCACTTICRIGLLYDHPQLWTRGGHLTTDTGSDHTRSHLALDSGETGDERTAF